MTPATDQVPGEVPRRGIRLVLAAIALLLIVGWLYYFFVVDVRMGRMLDAALVTVPAGFAQVLRTLTLLAAALLPVLFISAMLPRVADLLDPPAVSKEQMLAAVREGHLRAQAQSRELIEQQLANLSETDAAELRPMLEEGLRKAAADAASREERYAANPALIQRDLRAAVREIRAKHGTD